MQIFSGLDIGGLLSSLGSGGVGGLFGLTLRQMLNENGEDSNSDNGPILIQLLGEMTGQHIMQMFTARDFRFLKEKKPAMK